MGKKGATWPGIKTKRKGNEGVTCVEIECYAVHYRGEEKWPRMKKGGTGGLYNGNTLISNIVAKEQEEESEGGG